jgi:hypothetical protein
MKTAGTPKYHTRYSAPAFLWAKSGNLRIMPEKILNKGGKQSAKDNYSKFGLITEEAKTLRTGQYKPTH